MGDSQSAKKLNMSAKPSEKGLGGLREDGNHNPLPMILVLYRLADVLDGNPTHVVIVEQMKGLRGTFVCR